MKPTKKTRKPACELIESDLQTFPIWEFALGEEAVEGQDESWVRPVGAKKLPADACSQLVSAMFTTSEGRRFPGYLVVSTARSGPGELHHVGGELFCDGNRCSLVDLNGPGPSFLKHHSLATLEGFLKQKAAEIFPITFELLVLVEGESSPRQGTFKAKEGP